MGTWRTVILLGVIALYGHLSVANDSAIVSDDHDEVLTVAPRERMASSGSWFDGVGAGGPVLASNSSASGQTADSGPEADTGEYIVAPASDPDVTAPGAGLTVVPRLVSSRVYTRFDYLNWGGNGHTFDQGPLFTLGYERRVARERFRAEVFGSQTWHNGTVVVPGSLLPLSPPTTVPLSYGVANLGGRAEYDLLFGLDAPRPVTFFAGIGTRFWVHSPPNIVQVIPPYEFIRPTQATWVTIYPYIGAETRRNPTRRAEFYGRARIGILAATYEHEFGYGNSGPTLFPGPGVTGQTELGIRGDRFLLAGYFEAFAWPHKTITYGTYPYTLQAQPSLLLLTVGLKAGYMF